MAQLVEHRSRKAGVIGSSPIAGSTESQVSRYGGWPFLFLPRKNVIHPLGVLPYFVQILKRINVAKRANSTKKAKRPKGTSSRQGVHLKESIRVADGEERLSDFERLARQYLQTEVIGGRSLNVDFQHPDEELASLPGKYGRPNGAMFVVLVNELPAGCVAYRRVNEKTCELKRLYVRPEFRGRHLADALLDEAIAAARQAGYRYMVLDTLDTMERAISLYMRWGFEPCAAYYQNPLPGALFYRLKM